MKVEGSILLKARETWRPQQWSGQWQEALDLGKDFRLLGPVDVEGTVARVEEGYRFQGLLKALVQTACHRCLQTVELPMEVPLDGMFISNSLEKTAEEEELKEEPEIPTYPLLNQGELDLTELSQDALLLALPMKVLCQEDCQGLCPQCGTYLNEQSCTCQVEQGDPRLAPLLALLKQKEPS
ncbi:DUF177 domain-containing protein [Heliorestis acidaminivorans]|uniref:DUF177 domain-containing protein n=1 Tax=Heliorestis acidaminivorans TaxID=553427 RepID=A0A6I0F3W1_9FIRM|nr:DUF177 domain-containing protein [Heliorestis acidaminivorans]KAB2954450.1 DUF177 domain-containing protein [Heliorestis acidaminivorans]